MDKPIRQYFWFTPNEPKADEAKREQDEAKPTPPRDAPSDKPEGEGRS